MLRPRGYARAMPPRRRLLLLVIAGITLIVVGGAVLVLAPTSEFGWFAYAPLSDSVFSPGVFLGRAQLWGAATLAVGLVTCSWAAGYLAGRRDGKRP